MSDEFGLPDIGEGLAEGEIVKWLVAVGDTVVEDQPLVEVMTDKATVEIPSPRPGKIAELRAAEGEIVGIGTTILVFGDGGAAPGPAASAGGAVAPAISTEPAGSATSAAPAAGVTVGQIEQAREAARAQRDAVEAPSGGHKPWEAPAVPGGLVAPAARRLAAELGVDVDAIAGSGAAGLVTKEDVRAFAAGEAPTARPRVEVVPPAAVLETVEPPPPVSRPTPPVIDAVIAEPTVEIVEPLQTAPPIVESPAADRGADREADRGADREAQPGLQQEERVPLRGLRRTIAARMVEATTTVPHYTYVEEVDMTEVVALRDEAKPMAAERGLKLTYLPFIIRALVLTLRDHPYLNAMLDEEAGEIVLKHYYNIGIATNTERGLMVPVIRDAERRDLFDLAAEITRLSTAARDGSIGLEDLQDGTFTITSTGNIGGFLATPVINIPEVAILGITSIRERPVVRHGQIVIRHMLNLSLSCDHRVVDGAVAALFVRDLVKLLADPKLQLLAGQ